MLSLHLCGVSMCQLSSCSERIGKDMNRLKKSRGTWRTPNNSLVYEHVQTYKDKKLPKHSHIFHACDKQKMDVSDHMTKHKTPGDVADPRVMAGHVWMAWTWLCLSGSFGIWSILHVANKFRLGSFCQGMFLWHLGWVCDFILVNLFLPMFRNSIIINPYCDLMGCMHIYGGWF